MCSCRFVVYADLQDLTAFNYMRQLLLFCWEYSTSNIFATLAIGCIQKNLPKMNISAPFMDIRQVWSTEKDLERALLHLSRKLLDETMIDDALEGHMAFLIRLHFSSDKLADAIVDVEPEDPTETPMSDFQAVAVAMQRQLCIGGEEFQVQVAFLASSFFQLCLAGLSSWAHRFPQLLDYLFRMKILAMFGKVLILLISTRTEDISDRFAGTTVFFDLVSHKIYKPADSIYYQRFPKS
ncbi:hypothetical protein C8Q75DRAFT_311866 [Abortiporus biennis]|nr:hypothetical protein C8Q75DRAFT_311866 [Abortiporus biennis]